MKTTESSAAHTPTPWGIERTRNTNWIGTLREDGKVDEIVCQTDRCELRPESLAVNDANARLIVRAVNSHDAMRRALEFIAAWEPSAGREEPGGMSIIDAIDTARSALALAEGSEARP